jgi:hypothetical protein
VADKLAAAARSAVPPDVGVDVALGLAGLGAADDAPDTAMRAAERALEDALRAGPRRAR